MPNSLTLLSLLYKNAGFVKCVNENINIKIIIDTNVLLFLIKILIIYYIITNKNRQIIIKIFYMLDIFVK
jgi:hypothetical protein